MRTRKALIVLVIGMSASVGVQAEDTRVYQADSYGIQHNEPSYVVKEDGRVIPRDAYGNWPKDVPGYVIKGDKAYQINSRGEIQYNKPALKIGKDGRITQVDSYGNKRSDLPSYVIKGDRIYETDRSGSIRYNKPSFRVKPGQGGAETSRFGNPASQASPEVLMDRKAEQSNNRWEWDGGREAQTQQEGKGSSRW